MTAPEEVSEELIEERLASRPDLMERLKRGDGSALTEIVEVALETQVKRTTVRLLA
jgi:hypothetical protein